MTSNAFNVRAGNPPLFYWALEPLTALPFQRIAWAWIVAMYAYSAAGFVFALRFLGWSTWFIPAIVFLLLPETVTGALYGNVHGPVFAALSLSLLLMRRHPAIAGAVAALGWLKPQIVLPLVFVIIVFHCPHRKRMLVGFMSATALFRALFPSPLMSLATIALGLLLASEDRSELPDAPGHRIVPIRPEESS